MAGKKGPRKLLIASVGVATINYALACDTLGTSTTANLMAPPGGSFNNGIAGTGNVAGTPPTSGNLPAPMGGFPPFAGAGGSGGAQGGDAGSSMGGDGASGDGAGGDGAGGDGAGGDGAGGAPSGGNGSGGAGGEP